MHAVMLLMTHILTYTTLLSNPAYSGFMSSCREAIEMLMNTVHYESLALRVRVILTSSGALA